MRDVIISGIGIVVVFGVVVFVHELGHFLAAKAVGVYAPRFSIGFGPALWRMRRGETEYVLAALPLGGYVRMASRHDDATAWIEGGGESAPAVPTVGADGATKIAQEEYPEGWDPDAMRPFGPKPIPEHRWFESKPLPARLLILLAGVTMNIVLTYVIMTAIFATAGRTVLATRVVAEVDSLPGAGAAIAGVQPGDSIVRVNGAPVETWADIERAIVVSPGAEVRLETGRGMVAVPVGGEGAPSREDVARALTPYQPPVIDEVIPGSPAQRAGIAPGDSIVAIDGTPVHTFGDLVEAVTPAAGRELRMVVRRGAETREIVVRPESTKVTGGDPRASHVGRIGATPRAPTRSERLPFAEAAAFGWTRTWQMGGLIFTTLRDLGTGDVPLSELGGPGTIAVASAQAAQRGPVELLLLIALLSINVAVLNLLPIPILDGGQILLNVVESVKGSEFSPRTREYILRFGLVAILALFAIVLFNDTSRFVDFVRGIWN